MIQALAIIPFLYVKSTKNPKIDSQSKVKKNEELNLLSEIKKFEVFSYEITCHKILNQTEGIRRKTMYVGMDSQHSGKRRYNSTRELGVPELMTDRV